MITKILKSKIN